MLWHIALMCAFVIGCSRDLIYVFVEPLILGSHGVVYTDAARAWLAGGNPWTVGPPLVVFSGPPPMLLPFAPLTLLPADAVRVISVVGTAVLAFWTIRRLQLPLYWLLFPPLFSCILLGHPEVLVLALLVTGGPLSGVSAVIKPYAGLALVAERRWTAIGVAIAVVVVSAPFLPWPLFLSELPAISANIVRQAAGDSTFGNPLLMAIAAISLGALGLRRGLWLITPVLWPYAQWGYKTVSVPALSPIIAAFWALPVPGFTLVGLAIEAILIQVQRRRKLSRWLDTGVG